MGPTWEVSEASEGRPLHGVRVLDVSRIVAGPHCTMVLGDLGADVVKVEPPNGDETRRWGPPFVAGTAAYYFAVNRNKRSVALDLKSEAGQEDLRHLVSQADVLVQNFTAELAARFKVDAESVQAAHPRCIHVTISGFGPEQPDRRGYDLLAQALGGLMSVTGERDGRGLKVGVPIADLTAGTYAATAIAAALLDRQVSGRAARIEISLMDAVTSLLANQAMNWLLCGSVPRALGNDHPNLAPYGTFETATEAVVIAVASDAQFRELCAAIGRDELASDARFVTNSQRVDHLSDLQAALNQHLRSRPAQAWIATLSGSGIPCGVVRDVPAALASGDSHSVAAVDGIKQVLGPIRIDGRYLAPILPPPELGRHGDDLLPRRPGG